MSYVTINGELYTIAITSEITSHNEESYNMTEKIKLSLEIPEEYAGQRLDRILAQLFPEYSRSCLQNWLRDGQILVDDKQYRAKDKMHGGELIAIDAALKVQTSTLAQDISLNIVHEDAALIVINKPVGLVVHPAAGNPDNTLLNALLHHCPSLSNLPRGGIIHRIDKNTSGLLVIAKTLSSHHHLVQQLQDRTMGRTYETVVHGIITAGAKIDAPIARHPRNRLKMAVLHNGKPAVTHYRILEKFAAHIHLQVKLETGRTHQIRVHMAYINHPIVGDQTYGGRMRLPKGCSEDLKNLLQNFKRQALHAKQLQLTHPETGEIVSWEAPLPEDMQQLLAALRLTNQAP